MLNKLSESYKLWHSYLIHFPKLEKYTLGQKIDQLFVEVLEWLLMAKYSSQENKLDLLNKVIVKFDSLKFFLQIAWQIKALDNKKYLHLSKNLEEIGQMIGGWRNYLKK